MAKYLLATLAIIILLGGGYFFTRQPGNPFTKSSQAAKEALIRDDSFSIGDKGAKVTIVEFTDYQCPACGFTYPIVNQILKEYQGNIRLVVRHWPLTNQHKNAYIAAGAVEAANAQGKFWEMSEKLFTGQEVWSQSPKPLEIFTRYAKELKLDTTKFNQAATGNVFIAKIDRDIADAQTLKVPGLPTFYINGQRVVYSADFTAATLKKVIDSELAK